MTIAYLLNYQNTTFSARDILAFVVPLSQAAVGCGWCALHAASSRYTAGPELNTFGTQFIAVCSSPKLDMNRA